MAAEQRSGGGGRGGPRPRGRGGKPRYVPRRKVCGFCVDKVESIDYKDVGRLRRFLSDRGKIEPRRKTGTCARHQRKLSEALKRARFLALLPYTADHIRTITGRA
ncbi:MAG: 30S ribosomal protein S18 [Chloroflexota bacterium]